MSIFDLHPGAAASAFLLSLLLGYIWYSPRVFGDAWRLEQGLGDKAAGPESSLPAMASACLLQSWMVGVLVMLLHKGLLPSGTMILCLSSYISVAWLLRRVQAKNRKVALIDCSFLGATTILSYLMHSIIY
jgi:hypothetical protein